MQKLNEFSAGAAPSTFVFQIHISYHNPRQYNYTVLKLIGNIILENSKKANMMVKEHII